MRREFLLNIIFLIAVNLLIKPFYIFGIDRTVQNRVGMEEYGIFAALLNFTFLLQIINDFGIQNFNNRNIAQHRHLLPKYFPNILVLKGGLSIIYMIVVLFLAVMIDYDWQYFHLIAFLMVGQIFRSAAYFFRSNISGLGFYRTDSLLSSLDRLLLIGICSILLWTPVLGEPFRIEWFVYAQTLSIFLTALIAFLLVIRHLPSFRLRFNPAFLWLILKQSYPYALVIFLMTLYTRLDFVMIERLFESGERESGIYASAYRLLDAASMLGFLFAGLLIPMFARLLKTKITIQPLLRLSLKMILGISITTAVSVIVFRNEIMFLLYDDTSQYAADILGLLMFTFIIICGTYIYGALLTANDSLQKLNKIFGISVGLNFIFNLIMIPRYGAMGAAVTTLLTQTFAFIAQVMVAQRIFELTRDIRLIIRILFFTVTVVIIAYCTYQFSPFDWGINFIMVILSGGILGLIFRLFEIEALLGLASQDQTGNSI